MKNVIESNCRSSWIRKNPSESSLPKVTYYLCGENLGDLHERLGSVAVALSLAVEAWALENKSAEYNASDDNWTYTVIYPDMAFFSPVNPPSDISFVIQLDTFGDIVTYADKVRGEVFFLPQLR